MTGSPTQPRMLEGIRIVDMTSVVFGPYATQTLADLGADVIKVEAPGGDTMRYVGKAARSRGMGPCHLGLNRGKRSIVLDLKTAEDVAVMQALIAKADVFIHNVRERAIKALGFDEATVRGVRPDIIYVHCTGFGSDGPYAELQAYDDIIQAATGAATLAGRVDGDPRPRYLPSLIADKVAGLHGAYAVLAALVHRLRTGEGQKVEVPMFEAFAHFMLKEHLYGQTFDPPIGDVGYPRQLDRYRQPFPTANGHVCIVPYTDSAVLTAFQVLGRPDLLQVAPFDTPIGRAKAMSEIYAMMARLTPARTTEEWLALCHASRLPAAAVRDLAEVVDDPHLRATGFFRSEEHPTEGTMRDMAAPVRFAVNTPRPAPAPRLDEHGAPIRAAASEGCWPA